ncbi:PEP-CTERM sorting domain-containing protein [Rubritalea tangerina]|uniref:PEP-CTERM sorting domain-containing protein n=1 Tax=Rubritalea tangerina TaxID=430798 RepID=A0ABW4ZEJ7_9BACT
MKKTFLYSLGTALCFQPLTAATLTLADSDFETNTGAWTYFEAQHFSNWYTHNDGNSQALGLDTVLASQSRGAGSTIQQSFLTTEATADSYGSFTVLFDAGFRSYAASTLFQITFSIENLSDNTTLATSTFDFSNPSSTGIDIWSADDHSSQVNLTYDNTAASLAGDTIALRVTQTANSGNNWLTTSYIDNISVTATAVPEPSISSLIGIAGLSLLLRRRR